MIISVVHPKFTDNVLLEIQSSISAELRLYFLGRVALLKESPGAGAPRRKELSQQVV